jgi:hypothetical protein
LADGDDGWQAGNAIHGWPLQLRQVLPGISGESLKIAAGSLVIDSVKGQRGLPGPRDSSDYHELMARYFEVNSL